MSGRVESEAETHSVARWVANEFCPSSLVTHGYSIEVRSDTVERVCPAPVSNLQQQSPVSVNCTHYNQHVVLLK